MAKHYIYLDDVRTPEDPEWILVRTFQELIDKVVELGMENIHTISLDHDLGPESTRHFLRTAINTGRIDYSTINEKTGLDCAKWLVECSRVEEKPLPRILVHSANPVGSANIMGYINNYLYRNHLPQTCVRVQIAHTVDSRIAAQQGWQ